jgi:hypothetical protein
MSISEISSGENRPLENMFDHARFGMKIHYVNGHYLHTTPEVEQQLMERLAEAEHSVDEVKASERASHPSAFDNVDPDQAHRLLKDILATI